MKNGVIQISIIVACLAVNYAPNARGGAFWTAARWDHRDIRVCWMTPTQFALANKEFASRLGPDEVVTNSNQVRRLIESQIKSQYSPETTGIQFIGFNNCEVHRDNAGSIQIGADAMIFLVQPASAEPRSRNFEGQSVFHMPGSGVIPSIKIFIPLTRDLDLNGKMLKDGTEKIGLNLMENLLFVATHEFGHLAGLVHEHILHYEEFLADPSCEVTVERENEDLQPYHLSVRSSKADLDSFYHVYPSAVQLSDYDSNSIMNYCLAEQLGSTGTDFYALPDGSAGWDSVYQPIQTSTSSEKDFPKHSRFSDPTIFNIEPAPSLSNHDRVHVRARIRLSQKDTELLRSVYGVKYPSLKH